MPSSKMMWKVCGMRDEGNILKAAMLRPDFMGFIFYPGSPRYVGEHFPPERLSRLEGIRKVGVFVNQPVSEIRQMIDTYGLDYVQLHGDETPAVAGELQPFAGVIKVISGNDLPEPEVLKAYEPYISYWLVDTRTTEMRGGTGRKFDWRVLRELQLDRGILLSGGIGPEEVPEARKYARYNVVGVDVNSRAEDSPGLKNIETLKMIQNEIYG